jgi:hypothetical protein
MKIKPILLAEETGEGESQGGGVEVLKAPKAFRRAGGRSAAAAADKQEKETTAAEDREMFNKYNKLNSRGLPKQNSTLLQALNNAEKGEDEADELDDDQQDDQQDAPPPVRKEKKVDLLPPTDEKQEDPPVDSDDDLLKLDPAKIQNARGAPLSPKAADAFSRLKKGLTTKHTENEALKKEIEGLKTQLTEREGYDPELDKKYKSLKSEYDSEYFEKTDAFKEAYEKPIEVIKNDINNYFEIDPQDSDTIREVSGLFKQASELAAAGKKMAFAKVLNDIAEKHVDGGNVIQQMFSSDMLKWYDAINEYTKIYKVKDEERKQIISDKLKSRRNEGAGKIIGTIEEGVTSFKRNKKAVIDNLPDKLRDEYVKEIDDYAASIKDSVADFQLTGSLTPAITEVLQRGITSKAIEKELGIAWTAFGDIKNKNKILQDQVNDLQSKLTKLTGEPRRDSSTIRKPQTVTPANRYAPPARGTSRMAERLRANGGYDDE